MHHILYYRSDAWQVTAILYSTRLRCETQMVNFPTLNEIHQCLISDFRYMVTQVNERRLSMRYEALKHLSATRMTTYVTHCQDDLRTTSLVSTSDSIIFNRQSYI